MPYPVPSALQQQIAKRIIPRLQGSCLCGNIRWELPNAFLPQICVCHCRACRQFSGSTHLPFAAIERSRIWPLMEPFVRTEALNSYRSSVAATRYFCSTCSSPVIFDYHEEPNTMWIPMGSLVEDPDSGTGLDPNMLDPSRDSHIFANDRARYETALMSTTGEHALPRSVDFGIYKHDPCQPKEWSEIPTMEKNIRFVDDEE